MFGWLKRLFGFGKKKEIEILHNSVEKVEEIVEKEEDMTPEVQTKVPSSAIKEEVKEPTYVKFTDEDKEAIVEILRPLVKGLNTDAIYTQLCQILNNGRTLKTYCKLSDDGMSMTITLTQSKLFNNAIADFISDHVVSTFKSSIDAEFMGKYTFEAADGVITVKKIG